MLRCLLSTINCGEITAVGFFSRTDVGFVLTLFPFTSAATGLMYPTRAIVSVIKRICWWMRLTLYELKRVMTEPLWLSQGTKNARWQMCFVSMGGGCRWNWIHGHPWQTPWGRIICVTGVETHPIPCDCMSCIIYLRSRIDFGMQVQTAKDLQHLIDSDREYTGKFIFDLFVFEP